MTPALLLLASLALQDAPAASPVAASADSATPAAAAVPTLTGAPADDFAFVAWCRGALTGHMELSQAAAPEMARVREERVRTLLVGKSDAEAAKVRAAMAKDTAREAELDAEQRKAGETYLALYNSALTTAEAAGSSHARGEEAAGQGYRIWSAARASDPKTQMYAYLMWELPGRCETAAKSLKETSGLLGAAFKRAEAPPAPEAAPSPDSSAPDAPAPAPPAGAPAAPPSDAPAAPASSGPGA